ncbi:MAG TPA: replication initiation protein RepM, partial [Agitococcus sp.]|nr:replication initiation protein RepM [Agitococcus sp.]
VVKDNALIDASYNLELTEQRLILLAILNARETGQGIDANSVLRIHASDYMSHFDVDKHASYEALKNAVSNLFGRQFSYTEKDELTGKSKQVRSRWVQKIAYIDDIGVLELAFTMDVVPLITRLEQHFTSYQLEQVAQLTSKYAVRLYELIISWRERGNVPFTGLKELRLKLGVEDNEYPTMDNFKRRVLDHSIKQINTHTDIIANYEQHKAGRVITGFSFSFTPKKQPKNVTPKAKKSATKQEEQIDWMTVDILDRFIGLSMAQQQAALDRAEARLKGAKLARFKAARSGSVKQLMMEFSLDINEAMMKNIQ